MFFVDRFEKTNSSPTSASKSQKISFVPCGGAWSSKPADKVLFRKFSKNSALYKCLVRPNHLCQCLLFWAGSYSAIDFSNALRIRSAVSIEIDYKCSLKSGSPLLSVL